MLQNAYLLAKIGADTAENEQHFAKNLPKTGNYPAGPPAARHEEPADHMDDILADHVMEDHLVVLEKKGYSGL